MKLKLKNLAIAAAMLSLNALNGCKKDAVPTPTNANPQANTETYSSVNDFFAKNGPAMQTYTVTGSAGGSFTTPQGTQVTIPANAFVNSNSQVISGPVTVQFKDLYKKSDMLLSNMPPMLANGQPLKSGGEFFIRAFSGNTAVNLSGSNPISVMQPYNNLPADHNMLAYNLNTANNSGWQLVGDSISIIATGYQSQVYNFPAPLDSGSWCNTDDPSYFNAYTRTNLTLQTSSSLSGEFKAYLVFQSINTIIAYHTYPNYTGAPLGLQCTLVVLDVQNGQLYSAFVPITITANETVNYTLTPTSSASFQAQLSVL